MTRRRRTAPTPKTSGDWWEDRVTTAMDLMVLRGDLLSWHRLGAPYRQVGGLGRDGTFRARPKTRANPRTGKREALKAPCDWLALSRGCAYYGEDKATSGHRWPLSGLEPHQAEGLEHWELSGGVSCILLGYHQTRGRYVLPWRRLGPLWRRWEAGDAARGEASLTEEMAARIGGRWSMDWRSVLEAML